MSEQRESGMSLRSFLNWRGVLVAVVVYVLLKATVLRPSIEAQIDQCFVDLTDAIERRDPGDVLDRVSIDYPYNELWPEFREYLAVKTSREDDPRYVQRQKVGATLGQMFFVLKDESPRFTFEVLSVTDGDVPTATVRLEHVSGRSPRSFRTRSGGVDVTFRFEKVGMLFPSVLVIGHDKW